MILVRLVFLPYRLGFATGRVATKASYRTVRFVGLRRMALVGVGVGIGVLIAPGPGREMREKLKGLVSGGGAFPERERSGWPDAPVSTPTAAVPVSLGTNGHQ